MKTRLLFGILTVMGFLCLSQTTRTWDGDTDNDWSTSTNWSGNTVPTSSDNVVIPAHSSALEFDGSDKRVEISGLSSMSAVTLEAWINVDALPGSYVTILDFGDRPFFGFNGSNLIVYITGSNDVANAAFSSFIGSWTHVAVTIESGSQKLYINGSEVTYNTIGPGTATGFTLKTDFAIGYDGTDNPFDGKISEVRVWNDVRTSTEISDYYDVSLDGNEAGLVAYYTFSTTAGNVLKDFTANEHDGTVSGSPDWTGVVVSDEQACDDLTINEGSTLYIESGSALSIAGSVSGDGQTHIERNTTGTYGYSILGSPITSFQADQLGADYIHSYDGSSYSSNLATGSTDLTPGQGFFVSYDEASPTADFLGTPNVGTVTYAIGSTGFHLVANPYTTAISITDFLSGNTIDDGTVYFWDDGGSNVSGNRGGDYITVNSAGSTGTASDSDGVSGSSGTSAAANGYITSMQGVFINVPSTTGSISFTSSMQTITSGSNADGNHYRTQPPKRLKLAIEGNGSYSELLIALSENATLGFDEGWDALKLSGNDYLSFYSLLDQDKLAIQSFPVDAAEFSIPLGFSISETSEYRLKVVGVEGMEDHSWSLLDNETNSSYHLDEATELTFDGIIGETHDRFSLMMTGNAVLSTLDIEAEFIVYGNSAELIIESSLSGTHEVTIHTLDGRLVQSQQMDFTSSRVALTTNLNSHQLYILRAGSKTLKFIIH